MAPSSPKVNLNSSNALMRQMNDVLDRCMAVHKYYKSRWLKILIGISKMINATILMLLYGWRTDWNTKFNICLIFVTISCLTYLVEYGLSVFWWKNFYGIFSNDEKTTNYVVCTHSPFFTGKYHITIHKIESGSYFQSLPPPVVDETYDFCEYFTESGYFLRVQWKAKCEKLVARAFSTHQKDQ